MSRANAQNRREVVHRRRRLKSHRLMPRSAIVCINSIRTTRAAT